MGMMTFQMPVGISAEAVRELEHACVAGGPDHMPWPTQILQVPGLLHLSRASEDSGHLVAPWSIAGIGQLAGSSTTLMERLRPYALLIELARGKINQVRSQASDWEAGGLHIHSAINQRMIDATRAFSTAVTSPPEGNTTTPCERTLTLAYQSADELVQAYTEQVFQIRHQRQPRLDTSLMCRLGAEMPSVAQTEVLVPAFNRVTIPLSWNSVEVEETVYRWEMADAQLKWAGDQSFQLTAGPRIDFSTSQLPAWYRSIGRNVTTLASFMCRFVENAIRRYGNRIRRWQLTAASNWALGVGLAEDELLGLTYRLAETARQVDPTLELVIGISQPWGEYLTPTEHEYSPFLFADHLIRSGLMISALDLEVVMGVSPRGSYCRDRLELSRLLDLYAMLGVPLQVTLGYPSSQQPDANADRGQRVKAGCWSTGYTSEIQGAWAAAFTALALCKPYVAGVSWAQISDKGSHLWPNVGLFDVQDKAKPVLAALRELREVHLR